MFGILSLIYSFSFLANGIVILNQNRFLNKICLPLGEQHRNMLSPAKRKIVDLIKAVRTVCELPLIALNIFFIIYEILLG
jgi:hypothetical protein